MNISVSPKRVIVAAMPSGTAPKISLPSVAKGPRRFDAQAVSRLSRDCAKNRRVTLGVPWFSPKATSAAAFSTFRKGPSSFPCFPRPAVRRSWRCWAPATFSARAAWPASPSVWAARPPITPCTILIIEKNRMVRLLHKQHAMSDRFITHVLARNIRIEEDLIDQLFNSSEKRLARALLLLARYGKQDQPQRVVPKMSQETLAEMVGTTRSRVNFFLNKFKRLGFIEYDGGLKINSSLLSVVLHD